MRRLDADTLSWAGLLAHWIDFAKSARAWPDDAQGDAWRACVPAVINLQALTFALSELARVPAPDRPFARDRAEVMIRDAAAEVDRAWHDRLVPESLLEIADAARLALERSIWAGAEALVWHGGDPLVVPAVPVDAPGGSLAVMQPGTIAMPGEPVAWWHDRDPGPIAGALAGCEREAITVPPQIYRAVDPDGRILEDTVVAIDADPLPGMPLLVPVWVHGERVGTFTMEAGAWEARQRAGMPEGGVRVRRG